LIISHELQTPAAAHEPIKRLALSRIFASFGNLV
jgi:hypothetical protein